MISWNENRYKGMNRKDRDRGFRRQAILNATLEALLETSYHELTMNQIATKAELSAASLYLFFPNKRCLLAELLLQIFEGFLNELNERLNELPDWEAKLRYIIEAHLKLGSKDHADFLRMLGEVFYSAEADVPAAVTERLSSCRRQLLKGLQTILDQAKAADSLDFNTEHMALTIIGSLGALHHYAALGMLSKPPLAFADEAVRLVRRA